VRFAGIWTATYRHWRRCPDKGCDFYVVRAHVAILGEEAQATEPHPDGKARRSRGGAHTVGSTAPAVCSCVGRPSASTFWPSLTSPAPNSSPISSWFLDKDDVRLSSSQQIESW
jgi:hypothetical protein